MDLKEVGCGDVGRMYVMCLCEHYNERSYSIKGGEFLEQLRGC
jgi:hypothetical protein